MSKNKIMDKLKIILLGISLKSQWQIHLKRERVIMIIIFNKKSRKVKPDKNIIVNEFIFVFIFL